MRTSGTARYAILIATAIGLGCAAQPRAEVVETSPDSDDPPPPPPPPPPEQVAEPEPSPGGVAGERELGPIDEVMALGIYTPNPDPVKLQQTKAARFDKVDGSSVVHFCLTVSGETTDIRTVEKFPGDPLVDKILRDTVTTWRFKPRIVDGRPVEICTQRRFNIRFKNAEPPADAT